MPHHSLWLYNQTTYITHMSYKVYYLHFIIFIFVKMTHVWLHRIRSLKMTVINQKNATNGRFTWQKCWSIHYAGVSGQLCVIFPFCNLLSSTPLSSYCRSSSMSPPLEKGYAIPPSNLLTVATGLTFCSACFQSKCQFSGRTRTRSCICRTSASLCVFP